MTDIKFFINTWDDGLQEFQQLENVWTILETDLGKSVILNINGVTKTRCSTWKLLKIEVPE